MKKTILLSLAAALTSAASLGQTWVDLTSSYITNPGYDGSSNQGWTISASSSSTACDWEGQEFWNGTWDICQTLTLPAGHYRLSVQGFYRPGDFNDDTAADYTSASYTSLLYAQDQSTPLASVYSEHLGYNYAYGCWGSLGKWYPNNMQAAAYCFEQGMYENSLEFDVAEESLVQIGVRNNTYVASNWTMIDNWKLELQFSGTYVTSVTLSQTAASLIVGQQLQLSATYAPSDASLKAVTWRSSNESVATVDTEGNVTALAEGSATITATALDGGGASAQCKVSVGNGTEGLSSLVVTEIQSANIDQYIDPSWNYGGWVELYNASSSWVSLKGCWVSDDASNLQKAHITEALAIAPGEYYNLWFDHHDKYCPSQVDMKLD
ncbi:MAG: Ig-like domain-containing protein, partial [Prevotellaceae bacterium]|nr:Ig-like domain-containing protein [Prevotellaceae bacterium]